MYLNSENWLKGSVEYENDEFQHLGSVVTNQGYSELKLTECMWKAHEIEKQSICIDGDIGRTLSQLLI